jgi:hypothetical protein
MKIFVKAATAIAGVLAFGAVFAGSASACVPLFGPKPVAYGGGGSDRASLVFVASHQQEVNQVVGLWKFTFVSKGSTGIPDGTIIDSGYATWHNDGTEIMNSGRAPMTGSFCMGVWVQTGDYTYALNHFALSWDPTGTMLVGPANIKESITLDYSGTAFTGTFTLTQYDTKGNTLQTVTGTITATRINVDSSQ